MKKYLLIVLLCFKMCISCNEKSDDRAIDGNMTLINKVVYDMYTPNTAPEGYPHGVPKSWDWYYGPIIRDAPVAPHEWTAVIGWGVVYRDLSDASDNNTRVELSNIRCCMLKKSTGKWAVLSDAQPEGLLFSENLDQINCLPISANIRIEPDGNPSAKILHGRTWHHFPASRSSFNPDDIDGWYITYSAKLIIDDPNIADDRFKAKYIMQAGGDLWRSLSAPYPNNRCIAQSRFGYITNEWTDIHMTTLNLNKLKSNPPPTFNNCE